MKLRLSALFKTNMIEQINCELANLPTTYFYMGMLINLHANGPVPANGKPPVSFIELIIGKYCLCLKLMPSNAYKY